MLNEDLSKLHVVVMPDFFLDRIVALPLDSGRFSKKIDQVILTKGGSIDNISQVDQRGGNALNTASALEALGVKVTPIVCTSKLGIQLIKNYLNPDTNISHIRILEKASITPALEFPGEENKKINVMLRDTGSLAGFGPQDLNEEDFRVIEAADYICVFNWAGTKRFGTRLAETVFRRVKEKGRGKTYFDTADPTPNEHAIPELVNRVLKKDFLDILSVNENEAVTYASHVGWTGKGQKDSRFDEFAAEAAEALASEMRARIDLHTSRFSASFRKDKLVKVPSLEVPIFRATGSGDAWNAGNIVGDAFRLPDKCRLTLATLIAAYYISHSSGKHPSKKQLLAFCKKLAHNSS